MIRPITIEKAVPFYCLIAPEREISFEMIDGKMSAFYRRLFGSGSIDDAQLELSESFKMFNCERMLTFALEKYIKLNCRGAGLRARKERLISSAVKQGAPNTSKNLQAMRRLVREQIAPSENLIKKYVSQFLIGKNYAITFNQLLELID